MVKHLTSSHRRIFPPPALLALLPGLVPFCCVRCGQLWKKSGCAKHTNACTAPRPPSAQHAAIRPSTSARPASTISTAASGDPLPPHRVATYLTVSPSVRPYLIAIARPALQAAAASSDPALHAQVLSALSRLPSEALRKTTGHGTRGRASARLVNRLHELARTRALFDISELADADAPPFVAPPLPPLPPPTAAPPVDVIAAAAAAATAYERLISKVVELVRAGHIRKAVQRLEQQPIPPLTPARLAHLLSLHPLPSAALPPEPADALPPPVVEGGRLVALLRECDDGSAPGPSGLTAAHLLALASDPACLAGLVALIQNLLGGVATRAAVDLINAAVSIAAAKEGNRVRPLAVPEIIYRSTMLYAIDSAGPAIAALFPHIQLGCGVRSGVETAATRVLMALEAGGPDVVLLRTDFTNAFNARRRATIARALHSAPALSPLWRVFHLFYGVSSHMGVYERGQLVARFLNGEGVKQGCPLAALLFSLSVQHLYEQCCVGLRVHAYAIADDLTLVGPADQVQVALERLQRLTAVEGPELCLRKCEALWPRATDHAAYLPFVAAMHAAGVSVRHDTVAMLGTTAGLPDKRGAHCLAAAACSASLLAAVAHPLMPSQIAVLLLRYCAVPRMSYLTRVTPPSIIMPALEQFDAAIQQAAAAKLHLPASVATDIITRPIRFGGLGIRPHTRIAPAAYYAGTAAALLATTATLPLPDHAADTPTADFMARTHMQLLVAGVDPASALLHHSFPDDESALDFYAAMPDPARCNGLQRNLSRAMEGYQHATSPPPFPPQATRDGQRTHSWLSALPTTHYNNINTHHHRHALAHRYGLTAHRGFCACGKRLVHAHFHSCTRLRRTACLERHNLIVSVIAHYARRARMTVTIEQAARDADGNRTVPDLKLIGDEGITHVDVTVVCPFADSYATIIDPVPAREQQKRSKYEAGIAAEGELFLPFAVSSLGHLGADATAVIDLIISAAEAGCTEQPFTRNELTTAIAVQLQRGNGLVEAAGLRMNGRGHTTRLPPSACPLPFSPPLGAGEGKREADPSPPASPESAMEEPLHLTPPFSLQSSSPALSIATHPLSSTPAPRSLTLLLGAGPGGGQPP